MAFAFCFLSLLLGACPAQIRKDPATGQPYREPTVGEQLLALNVLFAQTNLSVQRGAIQAHALGMLPVGVAGDVVRATKRVAELDNDLLPLLAAAAQETPDIPALRAKLKQITDELTTVQVMNGLGIKNPDSQRTFAADALLLHSLVDQILALVERLIPSPQGAWNAIPAAHHTRLERGWLCLARIGGAGGALEAAARA